MAKKKRKKADKDLKTFLKTIGCPVRIFKDKPRKTRAYKMLRAFEAEEKKRMKRLQKMMVERVINPLIERLVREGVIPQPKKNQVGFTLTGTK